MTIEAQKFEVLKMRFLIYTQETFAAFMAESSHWRFRPDRAPVWQSSRSGWQGVEIS